MENWKDVVWYEWLYQVSDEGRFLSYYTWKYLKSDNSQGYSKIVLYKDKKGKTFTVHKIVMLCFIWDRPKDYDINHKDKNKKNNNRKNLEYCTRVENERHKRNFKWFVCPNTSRRRKISQFTKEWKYLRSYISIREAGRTTWVSNSHIVKSCKGLKWHNFVWWYNWKYKKENENTYEWKFIKTKEKRSIRKMFIQKNSNWKIMWTFNWRKEIEEKLWFNKSNVSKAISSWKIYNWYFWETKKIEL